LENRSNDAKTARDQLRKLDKSAARRIGKALKGPLGDLWRYRVGDYRVICDIQDGVLTILVLQIGN
jgi:mRNA interferase RelE/StbE